MSFLTLLYHGYENSDWGRQNDLFLLPFDVLKSLFFVFMLYVIHVVTQNVRQCRIKSVLASSF